MSDLRDELRSYFDDVVERVSVDDVLAQVQVRHGPRFAFLRPVRIMATAAASVLVGIGAALTAQMILRNAEAIGPSVTSVTGRVTDELWMLPVIVAASIAAGALAAVLWRYRPLRGEPMTTTDRLTTLQRTNRWLIIGLVVLLIIIAAGATWYLVSSPVPKDVQVLIDDYLDAWNAHDGARAAELAQRHASSGGTWSGPAEIAGLVNSLPPGWEVRAVGTPIVVEQSLGSGAYYLVVEPGQITDNGFESYSEGVSVFRIVRTADGDLRISNHEWMGP